MKHTLAIFTLVFCIMTNTYAQDEKIKLGIKGGLNIASISNTGSGSASYGGYSSSVKNNARLLPHLGVYSEFKFSEIFSLQPELLFSMKGSSIVSKATSPGSSSEYTNKIGLSYLDIPVQLRFNISKFHILVGPYVGFLLAANSKSKSEVINGSSKVVSESKSTSKDGLRSTDAGIYIGGGYEFDNGLNLGLRWCRGFSDIYEASNSSNNSNSVIQFSIGYKLAGF
jgi:hypothetical protein